MENAGQFIEDEELRAQIKGSGIGTSATRAEILKKLVNIEYLALNKKTQVLTPTQMGEMIYDVVSDSIRPLLKSGTDGQLGKGAYHGGGWCDHTGRVHGKADGFCGKANYRCTQPEQSGSAMETVPGYRRILSEEDKAIQCQK